MKSIYKILLITDNHSGSGGGAEKYFFTLKNALQQRPELSITSLGFGSERKVDKDSIVLKETSSKALHLWWRIFFHPIKYWQIRRAVKQIDPDVIHLHNTKKYTIALLKALRGYPVIQTVHDFSPICPTGWNLHKDLQPCATGLKKQCLWEHKRDLNSIFYLGALSAFMRAKKLLRHTVHKFIAPSPLLTTYLAKNHFTPAIFVPPFRNSSVAIDFSPMQANHFLYVGQLGKHKGVATLIDEFALACRTNRHLTLKIAGIGSEESLLRKKVKELGLENNISFLGWQDPEPLYNECAALIFPSIGLESFGLVLTEAMHHARAIIGSNRGPTTWLVDDEKTGLLFDPLKRGDLAEKILLLANNKKLAEQYGRAAHEKFNTFMSNDEIIDETIKIYKSAIH